MIKFTKGVSLVGTSFFKTIIIMNKSAIIIISLLSFLAISCNKKQESNVSSEEKLVFMELSQVDTTAVLSLVNQYLDKLLSGDYEAASNMLYVRSNDTIGKIPAHIANKMTLSMQAFQPIRYEIEHLKFRDEWDCEVKYVAILFEKEPDNTAPDRISFRLKPIRLNNQWYLTIADSEDLGTSASRIHD